MQCCLSQKVPLEPVVARTSGCLFEKSLIEHYIDEHGRCPVTGEPLAKEDLLPVRPAAPSATTAAVGAASIPGLLTQLHAEWEGMALEQFTLRQQLAQSQQELAHALQQYEAACVVIARLTEARDGLLRAASSGEAAANEESDDLVAVPAALAEAMDAQETARRQQRKAAKAQRGPTAVATAARRAQLAQLGAPQHFQMGGPRCAALSVACAATGPVVYAGGSGENQVVRYDLSTRAVTHRGVGHTAAVHAVRALPTGLSGSEVLSASADGSVRLWQSAADPSDALTCTHTLRYTHALSAVAHDLLCTHYLLAVGGAHVSLSDLSTGSHVASATAESAFVAAELHPYGALAGLGTATGELVLFDLRHMAVDTVIPLARLTQPSALAVQSIAFHADCLTVATGLASGAVALWDLRNVDEPIAVQPAATSVPAMVSFEGGHGAFLAVADAALSIFDTESFRTDSARPLFTHASKKAYKEVSWGPDAGYLAACTLDGVVEVFECA